MLEENDKRYLESQIDFIFKDKKRSDTWRIIELMKTFVASKSHSLHNGANPFYNGLTGHIIRKDYRRELMAHIRQYLDLKFKERATLPPLPKTKGL